MVMMMRWKILIFFEDIDSDEDKGDCLEVKSLRLSLRKERALSSSSN